MIYYTYYSSPVGHLLMLEQEGYLTNLDFEKEQGTPNPKWVEHNDRPLFQRLKIELERYFSGQVVDFSTIPLAPKGTEFQQKIWQALTQIPYGQTLTYGELAQLINKPQAVRAVGGAVGSNPISILIPCHRILGKNRELTGFGGGLPAKRFLLNLEKINYVDKGIEFVKPKLLKKYCS
ncbi:methylated-DNA--[protein]-cysteine S-methyltransferase [Conservatibacter flavescens]|uniref:Methylated-DNA--protein-cysteine methyltransferase n=1 Tax=Conservatibacter flavescens TaxID=28161 RepID=A0A2M8S1U2_9PAST|nr:methylated-DNA--[protein]-cysteine S-methyltransferase [Conservatibacter flavescens]PJG85097.1 cysteine methyltransferase [Conservatibacter flavescens]